MMQEEKLNFTIDLSGTYWDRRPQFSVWLDDHVVIQSEIASSAEQIVNFDRRVDEGPHELKIRLENKTINDTVLSNGEIIKDMLLNINDITIDDISIGSLIWDAEYILDTPQIYNGAEVTSMNGCVNLGWNGTYVLKFTSPFYVWLLEKL